MLIWKRYFGVGALAVVFAGPGSYAEAQKRKQPAQPAPRASAPSPGASGDGLETTNAELEIAPTPQSEVDEERNITWTGEAAEPAVINAPADAFAQEIANLWRCRYQVAMDQRKSPAETTAGKALIRFDVDPSGTVISPTVVALEPASPGVLSCAVREIQTWRMSPAPGQYLHVEKETSLSGPEPLQ